MHGTPTAAGVGVLAQIAFGNLNVILSHVINSLHQAQQLRNLTIGIRALTE